MTATLHVVIPALDEAGNIAAVMADLRALAARVEGRYALSAVLVDDGSSDGTGEAAVREAGALPLAVIRHDAPQGPGRAFADGFAHLAGRMAAEDRLLTLEADNTSRLELVDAMLRRMEEGYDVVLASPYMYGGGIVHTTPVRVLLSHIANAFIKELLSIHGLMTVSSFFRVYRGDAVDRLQSAYGPAIVERAGFESMVEMVMKLVYLDMRISEVPMVLDTSRRVGVSKMRIGRTGLGYLALLGGKRRWRTPAGRVP